MSVCLVGYCAMTPVPCYAINQAAWYLSDASVSLKVLSAVSGCFLTVLSSSAPAYLKSLPHLLNHSSKPVLESVVVRSTLADSQFVQLAQGLICLVTFFFSGLLVEVFSDISDAVIIFLSLYSQHFSSKIWGSSESDAFIFKVAISLTNDTISLCFGNHASPHSFVANVKSI